jgi:hypothetical protein
LEAVLEPDTVVAPTEELLAQIIEEQIAIKKRAAMSTDAPKILISLAYVE